MYGIGMCSCQCTGLVCAVVNVRDWYVQLSMYGIGMCSCQCTGLVCAVVNVRDWYVQLSMYGNGFQWLVPNEIDLSITSLKQCGFIVVANYR